MIETILILLSVGFIMLAALMAYMVVSIGAGVSLATKPKKINPVKRYMDAEGKIIIWKANHHNDWDKSMIGAELILTESKTPDLYRVHVDRQKVIDKFLSMSRDRLTFDGRIALFENDFVMLRMLIDPSKEN